VDVLFLGGRYQGLATYSVMGRTHACEGSCEEDHGKRSKVWTLMSRKLMTTSMEFRTSIQGLLSRGKKTPKDKMADDEVIKNLNKNLQFINLAIYNSSAASL
jgi:hypothetical protein